LTQRPAASLVKLSDATARMTLPPLDAERLDRLLTQYLQSVPLGDLHAAELSAAPADAARYRALIQQRAALQQAADDAARAVIATPPGFGTPEARKSLRQTVVQEMLRSPAKSLLELADDAAAARTAGRLLQADDIDRLIQQRLQGMSIGDLQAAAEAAGPDDAARYRAFMEQRAAMQKAVHGVSGFGLADEAAALRNLADGVRNDAGLLAARAAAGDDVAARAATELLARADDLTAQAAALEIQATRSMSERALGRFATQTTKVGMIGLIGLAVNNYMALDQWAGQNDVVEWWPSEKEAKLEGGWSRAAVVGRRTAAFVAAIQGVVLGDTLLRGRQLPGGHIYGGYGARIADARELRTKFGVVLTFGVPVWAGTHYFATRRPGSPEARAMEAVTGAGLVALNTAGDVSLSMTGAVETPGLVSVPVQSATGIARAAVGSGIRTVGQSISASAGALVEGAKQAYAVAAEGVRRAGPGIAATAATARAAAAAMPAQLAALGAELGSSTIPVPMLMVIPDCDPEDPESVQRAYMGVCKMEDAEQIS
jgi:hypothetical protein